MTLSQFIDHFSNLLVYVFYNPVGDGSPNRNGTEIPKDGMAYRLMYDDNDTGLNVVVITIILARRSFAGGREKRHCGSWEI